MKGDSPFSELLGLGLNKPEKYIPSSVYLTESVSVSVATLAQSLSVSKKHIINNVLRIGLEQYIKILREQRPDLAEEDGAWAFLTPSEVNMARDKYGDALQFDLVEESEKENS